MEYLFMFLIVLAAIIVAGWIMNAGDNFGPIEYSHEGYGG